MLRFVMTFIKLSSIALILSLGAVVFAQTTQKNDNVPADNSTAENSSVSSKDMYVSKNGKVDVPAEKSKPIGVPRVDAAVGNITVDGLLEEDAWKTATVFKDFYQTSPGVNIEPSKKTEAYMFYDEKNLYIAFRCWDDKDKIRATIAKRDNVFGEDNVRVWLDTYDDQRRAYVLGWNPLGIQADGILYRRTGFRFFG